MSVYIRSWLLVSLLAGGIETASEGEENQGDVALVLVL